MTRTSVWICAAVFCGVASGADEPPKPSLKLSDSVIRVLPTAEGAGTADVFVEAADFTKQELGTKPPAVKDAGVPKAPAVQISPAKFVRELSRSDTGGTWLYQVTVAGFPQQTSMARKMQLQLGKQQFVVDYTLTDKAAGAFAWSFLAPPVWNLVNSPVAEIPVVVKEVQATGIRLLQSTLTRQGEMAVSLQTGDLELCTQKEGACQPPDAIGPSTSKTLFLRMKTPANGTYAGNVVIRCDQKPEGDTVAVTANVTTTAAQGLGMAAVAAGVILYFVVVVIARWRLAKNSRRETALLLKRQVVAMKGQARNTVTSPDWAKADTVQAFEGLENRLSDQALRPLMPGPLDTDERMDEFKNHLQDVGLRLESLSVVVDLGLSKIREAWGFATGAAGTPAMQTAVRNGVHDLLAVPDGHINAADTKTRVAALLTAMYTAMGVNPPAAVDDDDVQVQLQHVWLSTEGWTWLVMVVWLLVTMLTGAMAMVFSKAGFGAPWDYAMCLLWGLGLPAAGTQLNQLSTSGIGTKLGITMPKAEA